MSGAASHTATVPVAVLTVTRDDVEELEPYFEALGQLDPQPAEVCVVDCASRDGSAQRARELGEPRFGRRFRLLGLDENRGFAGGMNAGLEASRSDWVLSLNADALPEPDFLARLLAAGARDDRIGAVAGRLLRTTPPGASSEPPRLDACGMRLTLGWRHLDRGSGEEDRGQFSDPARVFGATGAASLFRRAALDDVAVSGEVFATEFHSFREDAELCFRLRERGWEIVYEPQARARHRRFSLPERRASMPPELNRQSLVNRYLLRAYHETWTSALLTLAPALARELLILFFVLARERTSLPAYGHLLRNGRRIWARRRAIQARRTVSALRLGRWFLFDELPL